MPEKAERPTAGKNAGSHPDRGRTRKKLVRRNAKPPLRPSKPATDPYGYGRRRRKTA
jgi:hypothetical protein